MTHSVGQSTSPLTSLLFIYLLPSQFPLNSIKPFCPFLFLTIQVGGTATSPQGRHPYLTPTPFLSNYNTLSQLYTIPPSMIRPFVEHRQNQQHHTVSLHVPLTGRRPHIPAMNRWTPSLSSHHQYIYKTSSTIQLTQKRLTLWLKTQFTVHKVLTGSHVQLHVAPCTFSMDNLLLLRRMA